jgi:hypothetical protein
MKNSINAALVLAFTGSAAAREPITLEVSSGGVARKETPVRWEFPRGTDSTGPWRLVGLDSSKEVPVQIEEGEPAAAVWILESELAASAKRRYRLEPAKPSSSSKGVELKDIDGKHLLFRVSDKDAIRYNYGRIEPPANIEPIYARSGYIHPVWSPSGRELSNDFSPNHKHHHGIWMPWTKTEFEGRAVDFWNQGEGQGTVECVGVDKKVSGPVFGGFKARQRFLDLKAPGGTKTALDEVWEVKVYALEKCFLVDFVSTQTCATASPLQLKEYRYGGFGFRGSGEWEGKDGVEFLTSEGKTRLEGHGTKARWCEVHGKVKGEAAGIAFLCHPSNFRFPQNMRIHPDEPFFNFAPCQAGDFQIVPGKPYVSRYRLCLHDGAASAAEVERWWKDYAEPPEVKLVTAGK